MPQNSSNSKPPEVMTWGKAVPTLIVCALVDALRFMFEMFWFFGPAIAALYCTSKVGDVIGTVAGGLLCGGAAAAAGTAAVAVIGPFGIMMAMATGFAGWLLVGLGTYMFNSRLFKENGLLFAGSLLVSELPLVGALPALTVIMWRMYHNQIKKEKAALKKYEEGQEAARLKKQQREEAEQAQFMQANAEEPAMAGV